MPTEISRKLQNLMAKEMGHMGKFILKKQCDDIGIIMDDIKQSDLPKVADAIHQAIIVFTGKDKAARVDKEIRSLK